MPHEKFENLRMAEVAGDLVRCSTPPKQIDVDRAAASGILFPETHLGDASSDAGRIGVQVPAHQLQIAQSGSHEDVGPATLSHEIARDILAVLGIMSGLN